MQPDLQELKITDSELEVLSGQTLNELFMANLYRLSRGYSQKQFFLIIVNQVVVFGLSLIISLPLTLVLTNNTTYAPDDPRLITLFVKIFLGISLVISVCWNIYMWRKTKPLIELAKLQIQVNKYNEVIEALKIIDRLVAVGNLEINLINRDDVIQALQVTREGLISALKTERILRENQDFIVRRYELFVNIENNLATLMNFDVKNQATEYGKLLNEALEIGMTVQKEVRRLQNKS